MQAKNNELAKKLIRNTGSSLERNLEKLTGGELLQNIPNPCNGECSFYFKLNLPGFVDMAIYNNLGQQVDKIQIGYLDEGIHNANYQGQKLTEGIYFYCLRLDGINRDTKKMVINN